MRVLKFLLLLLAVTLTHDVPAQKADAIQGTWKAEAKELTITIYRQGDEYRGKVVAYQDRHHPDQDPATRLDVHNPNPALRTRNVIGMDVLTGLRYHDKGNTWEGGTLYHPGKGSSYSASAKINAAGKLEVRGYMGLSMIGKTMVFRRVTR